MQNPQHASLCSSPRRKRPAHDAHRFDPRRNHARLRRCSKPTSQSSTAYDGASARAVDGNTDGRWASNSTTHTNSQASAWWTVNLQQSTKINRVVVWNRAEVTERLSNFYVEVRDASNRPLLRRSFSGTAGQQTSFDFGGINGQIVVVQLNGTNVLSLAEVQVFGY